MLENISRRLARFERYLLIGLASLITLLILLNVVTRSFNYAIYWVDELAIYTMIWLVMVGASTTVRSRDGIAVTLLQGWLGERAWRVLAKIVDSIILLFGITLIWLCWIWYDPIKLSSFGFDTAAFSASTFNFIYDEPTLTIGVPKFIVWLIMPYAATTFTLHAAANLLTAPHKQAQTEP